jgi:hypothetical protein
MIEVPGKQGTLNWYEARLGIPTASRFAEIVTPTGKATTGKTRQTYINHLVYERLTHNVHIGFETNAMARGNELEPRARSWFELTTGKDVRQVGLCTNDAGTVGASPDGLIGETAGLEIKVPLPHTHVGYLRAGVLPMEYILQVQGGMYVTGRKLWVFLSYVPDPEIRNLMLTVERDPAIHDALSEHLPAFLKELDEATERARA